jgi:hypothetical protein
MSDPLALFPLALAAGGGRLDGVDVTASVAAGFTLLQRCAPLVRALAGKHGAALLPAGSGLLTALAASDGRALVWIDPGAPLDQLLSEIQQLDIGAVFTTAATADRLRAHASALTVVVSLDEAPAQAIVRLADRDIPIDLGSHFGLPLEGDREAEGRDEVCLRVAGRVHTHRELLQQAREFGRSAALTPVDRTCTIMPQVDVDLLVAGVAAPLLYGGQVFVMPHEDSVRIRELAPTRLVASGDDLQTRLTPH